MPIYHRLCRCGKNFTTTHARRTWHSNACRRKHTRAVDRERKANVPGEHSHEEWLQCLADSGFCCIYCEASITEETATKDHLTPVTRGGSHDITNIGPACGPCNRQKGNRTAEEYRTAVFHATAFTNHQTPAEEWKTFAQQLQSLADQKAMEPKKPAQSARVQELKSRLKRVGQ